MNALFKISNTESLGPRLKIREMARKMSVKPNRSSIDSTQQEEYPLLKDNLRSAEVVSYQSATTESKLKPNSEERPPNEHGDRPLDEDVSYHASMPTLTTGAAAKPEVMESSMQQGEYSQLSEHGDQQLANVVAAVEHVSVEIQQGIGRSLSESTEGFFSDRDDSSEVRDKYEDAALYVREGEDSDRFYKFPRKDRIRRFAYKLLLRSTYRVFHLVVCTLILLLALIEEPSLINLSEFSQDVIHAITRVHAVAEIFLLFLIVLDLLLRFCRFGPRQFILSRTSIITLICFLMFSEAIAVAVNQKNHVRITRAIRPIFFIDTHLMGGVRRIIRQFFQCFKRILDVLLLLMVSLVIFSLLGFLIFSKIDVTYFESFKKSIVSLFITMTTANHPDVLLEAFLRNQASPIFFVIYIIVMVYLISNVLLAVVHSSFSKRNKEKFKKLFLHKREVLQRVFKVLESTPGSGIEFQDFFWFMHHYRPRVPDWQVMCIFKALWDKGHTDENLSEEGFCYFYKYCDFKWKLKKNDDENMRCCFKCCSNKISRGYYKLRRVILDKVVEREWFDFGINVVLVINLILLVAYTLFIPEEDVGNQNYRHYRVASVYVSLLFVIIYMLEILLKVYAYGLVNYFGIRKPRNIIDGLVILTSFILLIVEATDPAYYSYLAVFRPIKFFRILRLKKRFRDIMSTLALLSYRIFSAFMLLIVIYYAFAIIGMEFFKYTVKEDCCNDSWYGVGEFYSGDNQTFTPNVYYILNFDNVIRSYVTLFVLMVVNNWFIIMEGFATTSDNGWLVRLYFMSFYIITMVVILVIISFIVDAFVMSLNWKEERRNCDMHPNDPACKCQRGRKQNKNVTLKKEDIEKLGETIERGGCCSSRFNQFIRHCRMVDLDPEKEVEVEGRRMRTKDDVQLLMYRNELKQWIEEREVDTQAKPNEATTRSRWKEVGDTICNITCKSLKYIVD